MANQYWYTTEEVNVFFFISYTVCNCIYIFFATYKLQSDHIVDTNLCRKAQFKKTA
jgi:hypothetical protein